MLGDAAADDEAAPSGDAEAPPDADELGLGGAAVVGDDDAEADSSPPPSTYRSVCPDTAAAEEGPIARGTDQAVDPLARSTAATSSRPTTIASESVRIGVGNPDQCVGSPMSAAACHETA